jgi:hypothetical protein
MTALQMSTPRLNRRTVIAWSLYAREFGPAAGRPYLLLTPKCAIACALLSIALKHS